MNYEAEITHLPDSKTAANWLRQQGVGALQTNSYKVQPQDGFIAWPGFSNDGRAYVPHAFQMGARVCLVERQELATATANWPTQLNPKMIASVSGLKAATGEIAAEFYAHPSEGLSVIAITGTNGKTSTAWWLAQALTTLGKSCGVMGTLGIGLPNDLKWNQTGLTTPDPVSIQHTLRHWANRGISVCAIEASSIGLREHRLDGLHIRVGIFTNLTQDHLDYHQTMEAYWDAKRSLFDFPNLEGAVINIDDACGERLAKELRHKRTDLNIWTYSQQSVSARLSCLSWHSTSAGMELRIKENGKEEVNLKVNFVGAYNISNLLAALCALRMLGIPLSTAVRACTSLSAVPGRMEIIKSLSGYDEHHPMVLIDYAHTPDALEKALTALRPIANHRDGKLHVIIGCGGNRDAVKRPLMGRIAEQYADEVWFTTDNPRSEDPQHILNQMLNGLQEKLYFVHIIEDRALAIKIAINSASPKDVILIAGKGHETTQEINGVKHSFSDAIEARKNLLNLIST